MEACFQAHRLQFLSLDSKQEKEVETVGRVCQHFNLILLSLTLGKHKMKCLTTVAIVQ